MMPLPVAHFRKPKFVRIFWLQIREQGNTWVVSKVIYDSDLFLKSGMEKMVKEEEMFVLFTKK